LGKENLTSNFYYLTSIRYLRNITNHRNSNIYEITNI
jgi:hypothetical protein